MEMDIEQPLPVRDNLIKEGGVVILLTHDNQHRITPPLHPKL